MFRQRRKGLGKRHGDGDFVVRYLKRSKVKGLLSDEIVCDNSQNFNFLSR
jgi:hypothetical protein